MATTGRGGAAAFSGEREDPRRDPGSVDGYLLAEFPWYGLDGAYDGPRWRTRVAFSAEGGVEHGGLGHGDRPGPWSGAADPAEDDWRFAVVVTLVDRPGRRSADGTGVLEATSVSSAAWLAGSGLLTCTRPQRMERGLRQDWLDQQTAIAWELADDLDGPAWSSLALPVDGVSTPFRHRESEYGWVVAGSVPGAHVGAYGRGMSPYGLGLAVVRDVTAYDGG